MTEGRRNLLGRIGHHEAAASMASTGNFMTWMKQIEKLKEEAGHITDVEQAYIEGYFQSVVDRHAADTMEDTEHPGKYDKGHLMIMHACPGIPKEEARQIAAAIWRTGFDIGRSEVKQ